MQPPDPQATPIAPAPPPKPHRPAMEIWYLAWREPTVANYVELLQDHDTSLKRACTWIAGAWVVRTILGIIIAASVGMSRYHALEFDFNSRAAVTERTYHAALCLNVVALPFLVVFALGAYLVFFVGAPHVTAVILGGKGTYDQTAFIFSAIFMPSVIVSTVAGLTPGHWILKLATWAFSTAVALATYALMTVGIKAVHQLSWRRSIAAVFLLPAIGIALIFMCVLTIAGLLIVAHAAA